MKLVETHAHLDSPRFEGERDEIVRRARASGVAEIVSIGADVDSSWSAVRFADRYDGVWAAVGVHPHAAESLSPESLAALRDLSRDPRVVAIGEVGLDYYRSHAPRRAQRAALDAQLEVATEARLPVVVHIREGAERSEAYDEALAALEGWLPGWRKGDGRPPGVLHCYSGDLPTAERALALGFYVGVDGPITYPNATVLRSTIGQLPLGRLLLETDCPYLAPQARRGRRNEPSYLIYIAQEVARLFDASVDEVAQTTAANARRVFGLSAAGSET
jgi:TatD DNase family protein